MDKPFTTLSDLARALAAIMNMISSEVQDHHEKVACLAWRIADEMDLSDIDKLAVVGGAMLHDVGGVVVSGELNIHDLERSAQMLAKAGAAILRSSAQTQNLADIVLNSQTPWRSLDPLKLVLKRFNPVLLGQIIHLSDVVSLMLDEKSPVLNQVDHIRDCVDAMGSREFHPEVRAAFDSVSRREAVWMDMLYHPHCFLDYLPGNRRVTLKETLQFTELVSHLIDYRSPFTAMHSAGVAATAQALAELAGMSDEECQIMRVAGNLHDIGKLTTPKAILEKPGKLTGEEFNVMKEHAYFTFRTLSAVHGFEQVTQWASFHHEKLNGSGYPFHLKAGEIPLGSRIMAVADVFSAITEDRPYRKSMERDQAIEVLKGDVDRGSLSSSLVEIMIENYDAVNQARDQAAHTAGQRYYEILDKEPRQ